MLLPCCLKNAQFLCAVRKHERALGHGIATLLRYNKEVRRVQSQLCYKKL